MIRAIIDRAFTADKHYVELCGLSTDSKPVVGIITGSRFTEVDTGDLYLFDESTTAWVKQ